MEQQKIDRINELYKKQKAEGLTKAEKEEQAQLRKEYVGLVRKNFKGTLNRVVVKDENGKIVPLRRKNTGQDS